MGKETSLPHSHLSAHPQNPAAATWLGRWLLTVCFFIAVMVIFGGYVRLTRSGLSIVEWQVVTGAWPPLNEAAWELTFEKYRQTPEFRHINARMTLPEYKAIYYREYIHRLLGRLTGLIYVLPLLIFWINGVIPRRKLPLFLGLGLLFALQGIAGWYMVKSGLVDRPQVSHYRLTLHLLLALLLFGGCFWLGLQYIIGIVPPSRASDQFKKLSLGLTAAIVLQIGYGGLVAGLKAGQFSSTFPLMGGQLVPPGLLSTLQPWLLNLTANPITVHFIHRWLAFVVLGLTVAGYFLAQKNNCSRPVRQATRLLLGLVGTQILLGIVVILWFVPSTLALLHQANGLVLLGTALWLNYHLLKRRPDSGAR